MFVAQVSVTSGIIFAEGTSDNNIPAAIKLAPKMAELLARDPEKVNDKCGDRFVASIGSGSDLYILLHFHDLTTQEKLALEFTSHASAGMGDLFNASGSSEFSATINDLNNHKKLDVTFLQEGGKIKVIPTTLDEAREKVKNLAQEEADGARPFNIEVIPYSELENWNGGYQLDSSDIRQRVIRFYKRLLSVNSEIQNIRENYYRDRTEDNSSALYSGDKYYYSYRHNMRVEDLLAASDSVRDAMDKTNELLELIGSAQCAENIVRQRPLIIPGRNLVQARKEHAAKVNALYSSADQCSSQIEEKIAQLRGLNDFYFVVGLPIPIDTISPDSIQQIEAASPGDAVAKVLFAQTVYRHWVERSDQIRCRLFRECLTTAEKLDLYNSIIKPISKFGPPLAIKNCTAGQEESLTVAAGYSVRISTKHTDTMDSIFTLRKRGSNGNIYPVISNQYSGDPASAGRVASDLSPFDVVVNGTECRSEEAGHCLHAMNGTCQLTGSLTGEFFFFDSGESGGKHNFEVHVELIPTSNLP